MFLKYVLSSACFESDEHEKARLIRVAINVCKGLLRNFFRSHTLPLEQLVRHPAQASPEHGDVWDALFSLPQKYRDVVYLHYFEGYTAPQISPIPGKNVNTVYTLLNRSSQLLREAPGEAYAYE